ncbi:MAG: glycosyltransferase family 2 protein [Roseobacter sp.]|nr:glycosyltransferase family 2 protein [Roseobacter sp.]
MQDIFYIIVPANNEENYIGACLQSLLDQKNPGEMQIIIAANACTDRTIEIAQALTEDFVAQGHRLVCIDLPEPGKIKALRAAEAYVPAHASRAYLDADVTCGATLIAKIRKTLKTSAPRYATGTMSVVPTENWTTRYYSQFWKKLPFFRSGAVGAGFFAVNAAGRDRWSEFPDVISDDTFVRLQFNPGERIEVSSPYHWPMVEGFSKLVRVRRRQDQGVAELMQRWPTIFKRENKPPLSASMLIRLAARDPLGFIVFSAVSLMVRLGSREVGWTRGR